jgi:undecaprenyl phosphate-alpha-L-ara4N flippase subunit ArnE
MALSGGQILFKLAARQWEEQALTDAILFNALKNRYLLLAVLLYAATTVLWLWILRRVPLNVAYPFTALAFVLVPLAGHFILEEPLNARLILGSLLIAMGICVAGGVKW